MVPVHSERSVSVSECCFLGLSSSLKDVPAEADASVHTAVLAWVGRCLLTPPALPGAMHCTSPPSLSMDTASRSACPDYEPRRLWAACGGTAPSPTAAADSSHGSSGLTCSPLSVRTDPGLWPGTLGSVFLSCTPVHVFPSLWRKLLCFHRIINDSEKKRKQAESYSCDPAVLTHHLDLELKPHAHQVIKDPAKGPQSLIS